MSNRSRKLELLQVVQQTYAAAAQASPGDACGCSCGCGAVTEGNYAGELLAGLAAMEGWSLGCGNPLAEAGLAQGERVLDLGSGAGLDAFLAARAVAPTGWAVGLDATPEMVSLARRNKAQHGIDNVEFLIGRMEHIPLRSGLFDAVLSNCVLNLSVDKSALVAEIYRVLRPGGRLVASDIVAARPVGEALRYDERLWSACFAGALSIDEWCKLLAGAGFCDVTVEPKRAYGRTDLSMAKLPDDAQEYMSAILKARRPLDP